MFSDITRPHPLIVRKRLVYLVYYAVEERACTGCRVENLYFVNCASFSALFGDAFPRFGHFDVYLACVCEALRQVEVGLEYVVDATNQVRDHWFRCVVDATCLPHFWVVRGKECLVEVHNRIFMPRLAAEVCEDCGHIRPSEQVGQIVDGPYDAV